MAYLSQSSSRSEHTQRRCRGRDRQAFATDNVPAKGSRTIPPGGQYCETSVFMQATTFCSGRSMTVLFESFGSGRIIFSCGGRRGILSITFVHDGKVEATNPAD